MEKFERTEKQLDTEQLKKKRMEIYEDDEKYARMVKFARKLQDKYEDFNDYLLYHFLIGSTPPHEMSKVDFPGEDSVEKFINSF